MIIGITYDLREEYRLLGYSEEEIAELDKIETIEAIEEAIEKLGHRTERIGGIKKLIEMLAQGKRWDMVFNICEGIRGLSRESQVPAVLDAYGIPYTFSDPLVLSLALHKGMAKRIARDLGIPTPHFAVVEEIGDINGIEAKGLKFPLFAKPVAEGTSKGIDRLSKVLNMKELDMVCKKLLQKFEQPVLVEEYLPGREFTAGIVGSGSDARVVGVMEVLINDGDDVSGYSYDNKMNYENAVKYRPVTGDVRELCSEPALKVWRGLGCRDGGRVDLKMDSDRIPNFIEVNPLAGLNPVYSDLPILARLNGAVYEELIGMIMESAFKRIGGGPITCT